MKADLHVHSTASDGTLRPADLVALALQRGLSVLAIADHDSVEGLPEAMGAAADTSLALIPAVELSSVTPDGDDVHMLGYFIRADDAHLLRHLADLRSARLSRAESMVGALNAAGYRVTLDDVLALSEGGAVGRSHVARALVAAGHAESVADAFKRLIGRGRPFYVAKDVRSPQDAIRCIREAGGLAVVAHPGVSRLEHLIPELADAGLAGIEAYHADHSARAAPPLRCACGRDGAAGHRRQRLPRVRCPQPAAGQRRHPRRGDLGVSGSRTELALTPKRATLPRAMQTYLIRTFGCQMNKHDSERVAGLLRAQSMSPVEDAENADVIVFMTCCVRENADERLRGQVASLKALKPGRGQGPLIAVGGCIGQRDGERLLEQLPHVDVVFGTHNIAHLPALLETASTRRLPQIEILAESTEFASDLPAEREHPWHAWVPITVGCDNYCTYCVVPYVRGKRRAARSTTSCTRSNVS